MGTFATQNFDYFLLLDFEATCSEDNHVNPMEIIEFPVLKVNGTTFEVESTFHRYVRPIKFSQLTDFCINLTGITQSMVDNADTFNTVFEDFKRWMANEMLVNYQQKPLQKFAFVTCSNWDLGTMLPKQGILSCVTIPGYMRNWIEIKKSFNANFGIWVSSQDDVIKRLKIEKVGREHSGIDDCQNLLLIVRAMALKGGHLNNNSVYRKVTSAMNDRPILTKKPLL